MKYQAISVSELNLYIKNKISEDEMLASVLVKGEISNFKNHYATGHLYFTLKDEKSLIKCIMFKGYADKLDFTPKDGMKVMIFGSVSVYERDGVYQIYAKAMQEDGMGNLYKAYEELKSRLEKEGLFDVAQKKKIPVFPKEIGVLTSQTGAVIRDIINVSTRRNPNVHIKLLPVPVQGEGAASKIAKGIETMNKLGNVDVIILARGGGSLEDLWPFNEEEVARAIYNSKLPIISAVGHETDFTIADFVADLRAPTPSAAAELAVPDIFKLKENIHVYQNRFKILLQKKLEFMKMRYEKCMKSRVFTDPTRKIQDEFMKIESHVKTIENTTKNIFNKEQTNYIKLITKLDSISPLKTLARGYTITQIDGNVVKSAKQISEGQEVDLKFVDGERKAKIIK
ncbi:MAG: exodeoxyribonuclease VII large subunit [Clostridia bacterium]|nr:exodeoxyribonuclease VII large subunit [Clostridia bacterium]